MMITLKRIDYDTAKTFFEMYEHLGNCGLGVWHWGAFSNSSLIAAVSFGTTCFWSNRGLLASIAHKFKVNIFQVCRGATIRAAPLNTPSHVLSSALNEFRKSRGDCLVVAYADRKHNEVGTIYQACNGIYTGRTNPKNQANYVIHGKTMNGWVVRKKFGTRSMEKLKSIDPNVVKMPLNCKYRYVFVKVAHPNRQHIIEALDPIVLPYPNRMVENIPSMAVVERVDSAGSVKWVGATETISV